MGMRTELEFKPRIWNHLAKGVFFGFLLYVTVSAMIRSHESSGSGLDSDVGRKPVSLVFCVLLWPMLAVVLRNIHALLIRPHLRLSAEGIDLRFWDKLGVIRGLLSPKLRVLTVNIPWEEYEGCQTFTKSFNGITHWKSLIIDTGSRSWEIGWGIFSKRLSRIQNGILNFIQAQFVQEARDEANIPDFNRQRFEVPLTIPYVSRWPVAMICTFVFIVGAVALGVIISAFGTDPPTGGMILAVIATGVMLFSFIGASEGFRAEWRCRGKHVLELRGEGIALGNDVGHMRVIAWEEILHTRRRSKTDVDMPGQDDLQAVEVILRDGTSVLLTPCYSRRLDEIDDLIEPPIDLLAEAWSYVEQGENIEAAAVYSGLPARGPDAWSQAPGEQT